MGSIYKKGKVYYIRYDLPRSVDGKRFQKAQACPGLNKKQAQARLDEIELAVQYGEYVNETNKTLGEYMTEWLDRRKPDLSPTTWDKYRSNMKLYIDPEIGGYRLSKITPAQLQKWVDNLNRNLSAKTVRNIYGMIRTALSDAKRLQIIRSNPAERVSPPRYRRPEMRTASDDGMAALVNAVSGKPYEIPIWIIICTGARKSEALGLQWSDFDEIAGNLVIQRNLVQVGGNLIVKGTKTERPRVVQLPLALIDQLRKHRKRQKETHGYDSEWICTDAHGKVMTPTALNSAFTDIKKALGLEFTLHSLRHTQATRLGMEHVPISLISQRLGHSNISTTQNIYTHVLPNKQDITVNVIEAMVDSIKEKAKKKAEEKESSAISCAPFVHPTSANTTF